MQTRNNRPLLFGFDLRLWWSFKVGVQGARHYNYYLYPTAPFSYIMFKTLTGPVGFSDTKCDTGHFTEKNLSSLARNEKVRKKTE